MAPIQSNVANPPNNCLQNFIHSGVVGGGVKAFGPSRSKFSEAFSSDRPLDEIRRYILYVSNNTKKGVRILQCAERVQTIKG